MTNCFWCQWKISLASSLCLGFPVNIRCSCAERRSQHFTQKLPARPHSLFLSTVEAVSGSWWDSESVLPFLISWYSSFGFVEMAVWKKKKKASEMFILLLLAGLLKTFKIPGSRLLLSSMFSVAPMVISSGQESSWAYGNTTLWSKATPNLSMDSRVWSKTRARCSVLTLWPKMYAFVLGY